MINLARIGLIAGISGLLSLPSAVRADEAAAIARIAGAVYLGDIPTAVADKFSIFQSNGVQAVVEYSESGQRSLARLRSGDVDFALMALTPFVLDRLADPDPGQPEDPIILASLVHSGELTRLFYRDDAGIDGPADLVGKRIAVQCGTNTDFALWLFLQFHGVDPGSVRRQCVDFGRTAQVLKTGRVDAAVLPDPWSFDADRSEAGASAVSTFDLRRIYTGSWVLVTTRHVVEGHLTRASRILAAYLDAIDLTENSPDQALEAYNARPFVPAPVSREQWEALDFDVTLTWALISAIRQQLDWARSTGAEGSDQLVAVLDLIDPRPLRQLQPHRVDIPVRLNEAPAR
ncbi:MAG: ABC transporter substrate-binding protein [Wenzhouxiangella sp.]|jgi:NitT/TauT family transport system substrate-binding protein|nr:ABC transporter substrate-binding protein [Wenzhouxiangella sp.]